MTTEDKTSPADAGPISSEGLGLAPERAPAAWADDHAIAGEVGNCASSAAKAYWLRSHWVDQKLAARLRHPLYSQAQLAAAVAAERERCMGAMDSYGRYWVENRGKIIDAITKSGFDLMSDREHFWLSKKA